MENTNQKNHPSYGTLYFGRVQSNQETPLFGSQVKHRDTIVMRVSKAKIIENSYARENICSDELILELEMSQSQFGQAISSFNISEGVPVTIRSLNQESIEECPFNGVIDRNIKHFEKQNNEKNKIANDLIAKTKSMFQANKIVTKKDRESVISLLYKLENEIGSNIAFTQELFNKSVEKTIEEAKLEIESFAQSKFLKSSSVNFLHMQDTEDEI